MTLGNWSFLNSFSDTDVMVRRGDMTLRFRDVQAEVSRLASLLRADDGPVFLYCEDTGNFLAGLLAALSVGRNVLLPGHATPGFLQEIDARGPALLCDVDGLDRTATMIAVTQSAADHAGHVDHLSYCDSATIGFFTSGSTGTPKICIKSQAQILAEAAMHVDLWGTPQGPVIGTVSHQHIYGLLFRLLWPLMSGKPVEALRQDMWEAIAFHARPGCVFVSSPAHLSRIPDGVELLHKPAHIFSSGGPLSYEAAQEALVKLGRTPIEVLGSTETGGVAWRQQDRKAARWVALPQVNIRAGEAGELTASSPFTGQSDFVALGDRVTVGPDGTFLLHARLDRIVKIEGKRISLQRVEEALLQTPYVIQAAAIDLPARGGALGAIVVLNPAARQDLEALGAFRFSRKIRQLLVQRMEPMELPRFWRFVDRMPENSQGKRVVADLRKLFERMNNELPTIVAREVFEERASFTLELNENLRWFDGHFPDQPILPGVAQVHIASLLAEEIWGLVATGADMARVKFRKAMFPGDKVQLDLTRIGSDRLNFCYLVKGEVTASGAIKSIKA